MIKVKNNRVINNLALKSFKANKARNWIAICAIALTTLLFTSLFTISIGVVESFQNQTMRQAGGDGHGVLKYLTDEQYEKVKDHPLIQRISYNKIIADSVESIELLKRPVEMYCMDKIGMELGFCKPTTGRVPISEKEIIADTKTLELLGVPLELGAKVPLTYIIKDKTYETEFVLSGYWESDPITSVGFVIVSPEFVSQNAEKLTHTYKEDLHLSGSINAYIMFENSYNIMEKLEQIIADSGYKDIEYNANWAYLSNSFGTIDLETVLAISLVIVLIIFTGYLIIYNIFQISIIKDIRLYGLLKTIGTTSKQLRKIILRQALLLSVMGIPIGLVLGFIVGKAILPLIMGTLNYTGVSVEVTLNPAIFIGATVFALITVWLSTRKPGKIAGKVSPVEAVKYSGVQEGLKKQIKHTTDGGKIYKMALSNLGRNKKRTLMAIISMTLSLVLLNSVLTIASGFDMDKYIANFVDADFLIGHANYFNSNYFGSREDALSESFIEAVAAQEGFEEGGRIYYNVNLGECSIDFESEDGLGYYRRPMNRANNGEPMLDLYGMDDFNLNRLDIIEGDFDLDTFKTGRYIIESVNEDDYGEIEWDTSDYAIGDVVRITVDGKSYEYEVMAKARRKHYTMTTRRFDEFGMYLPKETFLEIVEEPVIMNYNYNVADDYEEAMEAFLMQYTKQIEPLMDYESKGVFEENFKSFQRMFITVGGMLSLIIGFIGILNFINSIFTSILARRREFAILQSMGMTGKQLRKMLYFEGFYYALATTLFGIILGSISSLWGIQVIVGNLWFFSYEFIIMPILWITPALMIVSIFIPYSAYRSMNKQSIIERLREA